MSSKKQPSNKQKIQQNPAPKQAQAAPRAQSVKSASAGVLPSLKIYWTDIALILILTAVCFAPTLRMGFVNWDDELNLMDNANLKAFDWEHIKAIFSFSKGTIIGNYNPLPIFTFAIEKHLFGWNPKVFHLDNVILHILNTLLVYFLVRNLGLARVGAALATVLFAIHPMRVESVAWVTERKDVLFSLFYLGAMLAYVKGSRAGKPYKYRVIIYTCFILALFAKIQAVALPLSFIAVDYFFGKPLNLKIVKDKIPFFVLSLFFGLIGVYFLSQESNLNEGTPYALWQRLFVGSYSLYVYLVKFIFPYELSPLYPYPATIPWYFYVTALLVLGVGFAVYRAYKAGKKELVFGFLFFLFNVMFLLQVLGAGQGFLADRFTYMAYTGLFFVVGYYGDKLFSNPKTKNILIGTASAYLLVFFFITIKQVKIWESSETLWTHVLKYYDQVTLPFHNRGNYYREIGQYDKALADLNQAIKLKPTDYNLLNSRGRIYFTMNRFQEAYEDYTKAIQNKDDEGEFYVNRAAALAQLKRPQEAVADLNKGLQLKPNFLNGYKNRMLVHQELGMLQESLNDINSFIKLDPTENNMYYERARVLRMMKRDQEAMPDYNFAIQNDPNNTLFLLERSKAHAALGNKAAALADALKAQNLGGKVEPAYIQSLR